MKYFLLFLSPLLLATEATLTVQEHNSIHGYNHRPIVKMQQKNKMHKLHNIDEKMLAIIVIEETKEEIKSAKLTHRGNILKYEVITKHCHLSINALDGTIEEKTCK